MIETIAAVRNMRLYDPIDGKKCVIPPIVSIYIPASAGPIEAPTILIRLLIPSDIPLDCLGVESIITFIAPTLVNDNPADKMARFTDIPISV